MFAKMMFTNGIDIKDVACDGDGLTAMTIGLERMRKEEILGASAKTIKKILGENRNRSHTSVKRDK